MSAILSSRSPIINFSSEWGTKENNLKGVSKGHLIEIVKDAISFNSDLSRTKEIIVSKGVHQIEQDGSAHMTIRYLAYINPRTGVKNFRTMHINVINKSGRWSLLNVESLKDSNSIASASGYLEKKQETVSLTTDLLQNAKTFKIGKKKKKRAPLQKPAESREPMPVAVAASVKTVAETPVDIFNNPKNRSSEESITAD